MLYRFTKINTERMQEQMLHRSNPGLSPKAARVLGAVLLGIGGVILGAWVAAVPLTHSPLLFLNAVLSIGFVVSLVYASWLLYTVLLSEQDAASMGWWPVKPQSLALAKVLFIVQELSLGAAIVVGPMTLAWTLRGPVPVGSAIGFSIAVALCIWLAIMLALLLISTSLRHLGVRGTRNVGLALIAIGVFAYFSIVMAEDRMDAIVQAVARSDFWPPAWLAFLGGAATLPGAAQLAWLGGHLLFVTAVTWLAFRSIAPGLMAGFSEPTIGPHRTTGLLTRYFAWWGGGREWRILSRLYVAHVRSDWRFRRHLAGLGGWFLIMILMAATVDNIGARLVTRDPTLGLFTPGMIAFGAAIIIPLVVYPMLSASSESKAIWIVYAGNVNRLRMALAVRQLIRAVYLYPLLVFAAYLYFGTGGASLDSIKQFVLLALTVELATAIVHRIYDVFPFTLPADISKTHSGLVVTGILAQFLGFVYVLFIFGLALKFWPVYILTALGIILGIAELNRRFRAKVEAEYSRLEYLD